MAKIMNDNFQINVGNPIDSKYLNASNQPYANAAAVLSAIPESQRYIGLTVNVNNVEYWFYTGVLDGNFVIKDSGIASTGITRAINGLTKIGNAVSLGGTLTGATTLTAITGSQLTFTDSRTPTIGIQYGGEYCAGFTARSLVDKQYVTGITSQSIICANNGLNKAGQNVRLGGDLTGDTLITAGGNDFAVCGTNASLRLLPSGGYLSGGTLELRYDGAKKVTLSTLGFEIEGPSKFYSVTEYNSNVSPFTALQIPDAQWVTGKTSQGIICANNGLNKAGQNVRLGGNLTGNTCIGINGKILLITGGTQFGLDVRPNEVSLGDYNTAGTHYIVNDTAVSSFSQANGTNNANFDVYACGSVQLQGKRNNSEGFVSINNATETGVGICSYKTGCNPTYLQVFTGTTTLGSGIPGFKGAQYAGVYRNNFVCDSLVDAAYVTGKTKYITKVGSADQIIYNNGTQLTGCTNMKYCDALTSFQFGCLANATGCRSFAFGCLTDVGGSDSVGIGRGATVSGADSAILGGYNSGVASPCSAIIGGYSNCVGAVNLRSAIIGGQNIVMTAATYCDTVAVPCLAIMMTPSGVGNLLCWDTTSKKLGVTSLSAFGGVTGGTNGIVDCGSQRLGLGGALIANTSICGEGKNLSLGTAASKLAIASIISSGNTNICGGIIGINGSCINMSSSGATFTDTTAVAKQGIKYNADYSLTYGIRSLVDKGYVDSIATGLNIHAAVDAATTVPITLSGSPKTIDGISLVAGNRVLVKNQSSGATNGIYVVTGGTWQRADDYNGTPSGEVSNGDIIPVTSGMTQNNTLWALTTLNPITVGVSDLVFTLFSTNIDIAPTGDGILVPMVGGQHTVNINLAPNSGLCLTPTQLCVASTIAGCGLGYSAGVLNVNAASCGSVSAIPVGYNAGDCLVVAVSDIRGAVNALTGATNGLTATNCVVKLGGALTEATTIYGTNTQPLAMTGLTTFNLGFGAGNVAGIVRDSNASPRGLQYYGDYSTTFCDNSLVTKQYVATQTTGITTGYLCCANNGLNKAGQNVRLGGALTGATTINGAQTLNINQTNLNLSGNTAFALRYGTGTFTNAGGTCGLKYAAYYGATNVAQSIPDAQWVTGFTACANAISLKAITGVTNGLTCVATHCARLGGSLGQTTSIFYDGFDLNLCTGTGNGLALASASCVGMINMEDATTNCHGAFAIDPTEVSLQLTISATTQSVVIVRPTCAEMHFSNDGTTTCATLGGYAGGCVLLSSIGAGACKTNLSLTPNCGLISSDCTTFKGLQYLSGGYRTNFACNSLVDAAYVTGKTSTSGIQTACNGLTKSGSVVILGGNLTGNTSIGVSGKEFKICGALSSQYLSICDSGNLGCIIMNSNTGSTFINGGTGLGKFITIGSNATYNLNACSCNSMLLCTPQLSFDFSTTGTVTDGSGNGYGLQYANDYSSTFCNNSLITKKYVCSQTSGVTTGYLCCANNGLNKAGQNVRLGGPLTGTTTINGAQTLNINQTVLNLSGNTSVNIKGTAVTLQSTPPTGLVTDSVLVWNSVDKQLKIVSGAANNIYTKTVVSANATGTTASTYVQLISGATTFTLPSAPIAGQAFKFKDAAGTALSANIVINAGSGKTIDGSQCALINTDYGALELVYGATNKWFSLAFIN